MRRAAFGADGERGLADRRDDLRGRRPGIDPACAPRSAARAARRADAAIASAWRYCAVLPPARQPEAPRRARGRCSDDRRRGRAAGAVPSSISRRSVRVAELEEDRPLERPGAACQLAATALAARHARRLARDFGERAARRQDVLARRLVGVGGEGAGDVRGNRDRRPCAAGCAVVGVASRTPLGERVGRVRQRHCLVPEGMALVGGRSGMRVSRSRVRAGPCRRLSAIRMMRSHRSTARGSDRDPRPT